MSSAAAGIGFLLFFSVSQGVRDAFFGNVFQAVSFWLIAVLAFGVSCVVFCAVSRQRRPKDLVTLAAKPGDLFSLNLTTAMAWLGFFFGLKFLEPAIVATLYNGVGPLVILVIQGTRFGPPKASTGPLEMSAYLGIAAALGALAFVALTNRSGMSGVDVVTQALAIGVVTLSGAMITVSHYIAKTLNDADVGSDALMGTRFLLTVAIAAIAQTFAQGSGPSPSAAELLWLTFAAFLLITIPSFAVQLGIARASPLAVNVIRATGPVFVFAFQQLDGRLSFSTPTLACIVTFCVFATLASVVRAWRETASA